MVVNQFNLISITHMDIILINSNILNLYLGLFINYHVFMDDNELTNLGVGMLFSWLLNI